MKLYGMGMGTLLLLFLYARSMEKMSPVLVNKMNYVCNQTVLMLEKDNKIEKRSFSNGSLTKRKVLLDTDNQHHKDWQKFVAAENMSK